MNTLTKAKIKDTVEKIVCVIISPISLSAVGGVMLYDHITNRRQKNIARDVKRLRKILESDFITVKK